MHKKGLSVKKALLTYTFQYLYFGLLVLAEVSGGDLQAHSVLTCFLPTLRSLAADCSGTGG